MNIIHHSCGHTSQYAARITPDEMQRRKSRPCRECELEIARRAIQRALGPIKLTDQEEALYSEAEKRARELGRPFEEREVFGFAWEQGYELIPQCDPYQRFVVHRESIGSRKRLWTLRAE